MDTIMKRRAFRDAFFREFKQLQVFLLQSAINTNTEEPCVIIGYWSSVAEGYAHACYEKATDRIIAISCTHWHDSLPEKVDIKVHALFTKIWRTPYPVNYRFARHVKWRLLLSDCLGMPDKLSLTSRYEMFTFTNYEKYKFGWYHHLN